MPPTSKENEVLVAAPEGPATAPAAFRADETASRPSPVALEVPVSVNGARTVEGSDKREPFSETTKTVLVFGNGAVIRLSSPVAAGQLLFLTNEKTKKEVVCQVVKSKNYRSVSGYVELEFTESVVGFWGMRFPTDRVAAPAPTATSGVATPSAAKPAAPVAIAPKAPVVPPAATIAPPSGQPTVPASVPHVRPAAPALVPPQTVASKTPPPAPVAKAPEAPTIAASLASSVASLLASPEVPPAAVPKAPAHQAVAQSGPTPVNSGEASTEELKQQAARLQEQLSSMLFGASSNATQQPTIRSGNEAAASSESPASLTSKVLEMARPEPLAPPKLTTTGKPVPAPIKSSLDTEEVKIPSWLEPLARNAAAPTSTQELIEREKAKHAAELAAREREEAKPEPLAAEPAASVTVATPAAEAPAMADLLPLEGENLNQPVQSGSKRGLWIGIAAAAILAAAGGGWYFLHPTNGGQNTTAQSARATAPAASAPAAVQPQAQPTPQTSAAASQPVSKPSVSEPLANAPITTAPINAQPVPLNRDNRASGTPIPASSTERIGRSAPPAAAPAPAKPESKKPSLGDVHLATPTVSRSANGGDDGLAAPTISSGTDASGSGLSSGLAVAAPGEPAAPKAPLPVGGDVKPAKLLSSAAPIYPALAKTQHVSGDVSIDALIDANGKVTTMKVLSGPTLLRQAAMDAVHQWKYQAATLDGNPVAMHLTVTVQFRIQ